MRSRAARLISSALACLVLGSALFFLRYSSQQLDTRLNVARQFDQRVHEASASLGAAKAALQAYVAAGQSSSAWMPKVKALSNQAAANIDALRSLATSSAARQGLLEASASLTELNKIDKRAREYLAGDDPLMASDVVFSEGGDAVADVEAHINAARLAEQELLDTTAAAIRRQQAYAGIAAASFVGLVTVALGLRRDPPAAVAIVETTTPPAAAVPVIREPVAPVLTDESPSRDGAALTAAAEISTTFGQIQDITGLKRALAQAATVLDASGLVVWLGSAEGADLRAVVAHGYSDHVLGMMRPVPRAADNAAATAYRSSKLQIVAAKPGTSLGAVVAPIIAADGCIGALTAELKNDGEVSETVHAIATIIASQLAGVLSSAATEPASSAPRAASA